MNNNWDEEMNELIKKCFEINNEVEKTKNNIILHSTYFYDNCAKLTPELGVGKNYDNLYGNIGNPLPPLYSIAHDSHEEEKEVIVTKMKLSGYLDENGNLKIDKEFLEFIKDTKII